MSYSSPGNIDELPLDLLKKWNETIQIHYDRLDSFKTRFFSIDPSSINNSIKVPITWFGNPAEPEFCIGPRVALELSDWGVKGRHGLHNEYCEYSIIKKLDKNGKLRPKRVQITTELREYWVCIAQHDPDLLRNTVMKILGVLPDWNDLYGVDDPFKLTIKQREIAFSTYVAGHGNDSELKKQYVPEQPIGKLNTENALFMTHPINGLDDLLYIVMFGAKPYVSKTNEGYRAATKEEIFRSNNVEQLACRHADPAAAIGAHGAAMEGRTVVFSNPLGMYLHSFTEKVFSFEGKSLPNSWIRWSRGSPGMYQRLEVGPSDDEPYFLDDIKVTIGDKEETLSGGYRIVQHIEVGPIVEVSKPSPLADSDYVLVKENSNTTIKCNEAKICNFIKKLKTEYDNSSQLTKMAPRIMSYS